MTKKKLLDILRSGGRVYGTLIVSTSPKWPQAIHQAGLDFVFIDTEHVPIEPGTLSWMCQTYSAAGLPALVRIPNPNPEDVGLVLDGGAGGIVVPYVETAEQVRELVGAVKMRPLKGKLGGAILQEPEQLNPNVKQYLEDYNAGNMLVVNIESVPALKNLDAILSVSGLDAVLIGPHDLSVSMGIPEQYWDPGFDEAVRDIVKRARDHHVAVGIHFWEGLDQELAWAQAGANLIVHSGDLRLFVDSLREDISALRKALGDEVPDPGEGEGSGKGRSGVRGVSL